MSSWTFDAEEIRALIQGKFVLYPCLECQGKGKIRSDSNGNVIGFLSEQEDSELQICDSCSGIGGKIIFNEDL